MSRKGWPTLWVVLGIAGIAVGAWIGKQKNRAVGPDGYDGQTPAKSDASVFATYAGSASCADCHTNAFRLWHDSHHALAERKLDAARDRAAFDPPRSVTHASQASDLRWLKQHAEIVAPAGGAQRQTFPLERVVGEAPLRQFLTANRGGRWQVTELAFDPAAGDWFDVFGDEDRKPGEWGHWTGRGMTWNSMCAACHNTRLRKNYIPATDAYATTMAEMGVGCEACHGPMKDHVAWQRSPQATDKSAKDPTVRRLTRDQMLDTCGMCHSRRAEITGDFVPGDNFFDHAILTVPDETDIYHADGQVRDEDYEFASFLGSRMHAKGVSCADCHEPHSGKTILPDNQLCMRCHGQPLPPAPKIDPVEHGHHDLTKAGSRCVDCHMPLTTYMQRHPRRDHGFTIPDPLLTQRYGIPNACNRCHTDKTTEWALAAVDEWYGSRMDRWTRTRAIAVAEGRLGRDSARTNLVAMLQQETNAVWRASAASLLKPWVADPLVMPALIRSAADPDPIVRAFATRTLEPLAHRGDATVVSMSKRLLTDPVRAVRVEAAWALRTQLEMNSTAGRDLAAFLVHNSDQPGGLLQQSVWHLDRGDAQTALDHLRRAVQWDGGSAPLRRALAIALSTAGVPHEAVRELETACKLAPREAEYRFQLALALNEMSRLNEAVGALEEAVKLDPEFSRAWYNLGLGYSAQEKPDRALDALTRAEKLDGTSAEIPYARATVLAKLERVEDARRAAGRALELAPSFQQARELFELLSVKGAQP